MTRVYRITSIFLRFSQASQHPVCLDQSTKHGKSLGISLILLYVALIRLQAVHIHVTLHSSS